MKTYRVHLSECGLAKVLPAVQIGYVEVDADNSALAALRAGAIAFNAGFVGARIDAIELLKGGLNDAN